MKKYYNSENNKWYYEGNTITMRVDNGIFSGIPTEEQLEEWGYEVYTPPTPKEPTEEDLKQQRMNEILYELQSMDYLTSKYIDGEDMTEYGDWMEKRKALREEYRQLENKE